MKTHFAIYGNKVMKRAHCYRCKEFALVIGNMLQCCDTPINEITIDSKVMSLAVNQRKGPPKKEKLEILKRQNNMCVYCGIEFGTYIWREKTAKMILVKINFDHFVPFSYSYNNQKVNFVAACHICNGIKGNKMFNTIEEVSDFVKYHRKKKGYKTNQEINLPDMQPAVPA